jgi:hypothetical protein
MDNKVSIESVINLSYKIFGAIVMYKIMVSLQNLVQIGINIVNANNSVFK